MLIWPAIDIRDGKCVRLTQGDYAQQTVYGDSPADMAGQFVSNGATGLHVVDLDAARDGTLHNKEAIATIAREVKVPLQLGGGIRSRAIIAEYFELGVDRLVVGTRAQKDPRWLAEMCRLYPGRLIVGIDARHGRVTTNGWLNTSDTMAVDLARQINDFALGGVIYTDILRDGMMAGPNFGAMQEMAGVVAFPLIASGGVTTVDDIRRLAELGLAGCVVGKALYEGRLTLADALEAAAVPDSPESSRSSSPG
jgi:phosphoribosylformimino-5-aminoimidazole carboxamide ribotide isomerase